jgi:hypothetical protein
MDFLPPIYCVKGGFHRAATAVLNSALSQMSWAT